MLNKNTKNNKINIFETFTYRRKTNFYWDIFGIFPASQQTGCNEEQAALGQICQICAVAESEKLIRIAVQFCFFLPHTFSSSTCHSPNRVTHPTVTLGHSGRTERDWNSYDATWWGWGFTPTWPLGQEQHHPSTIRRSKTPRLPLAIWTGVFSSLFSM